jgi:hypothetical protein
MRSFLAKIVAESAYDTKVNRVRQWGQTGTVFISK